MPTTSSTRGSRQKDRGPGRGKPVRPRKWAGRAWRRAAAVNILSDDDETGSVVEAAGHFRIYLGAVAGVGKTYDMLNEGKRRLSAAPMSLSV